MHSKRRHFSFLGILAAGLLLVPLVSLPVMAQFTRPSEKQSDAATAPSLRVVQWNIGHFAMGKSSNPKIRPEMSEKRAAEYRAKIAELNADFLGICEFDSFFSTSKTSSVEKVFSSFPYFVAGPKRGYQSNAIFSKFQSLRHTVVPYAQRHQATYFLDSVYLVGGREVHFVQTHLDWDINKKAALARPKQIQQLIDHFADTPYVIIAGDFNVATAEEYQPFVKAGWRIANCSPEAGTLNTIRGKNQATPNCSRPLDNIIAKGFRLSEVTLDDMDFQLSDHRILRCLAIMV